jgi:molecular chaperone GrpE (heat shock protein)
MSVSVPWSSRPQDPAANIAREHASLLRGLIGVLDQIETWEANAPQAEAERVARVRDGLVRLLLSHGLRPTARTGTPVDLRFHEVVATRLAAPTETADCVAEIIQSGWELMAAGERSTMRVAKVVVAVAAPDQTMPVTARLSDVDQQPDQARNKDQHQEENHE